MIGIRRLREESFRRRVGLALCLSCLAVALVVTLWPFRFSLATASFARIDWRLYYRSRTGHVIVDRDLLQNLVMLSPLGAGWALLRGPRGVGRIALEATTLGVGLAATIETLQIFAPTRFPQLADVWRNGASIARRMSRSPRGTARYGGLVVIRSTCGTSQATSTAPATQPAPLRQTSANWGNRVGAKI